MERKLFKGGRRKLRVLYLCCNSKLKQNKTPYFLNKSIKFSIRKDNIGQRWI